MAMTCVYPACSTGATSREQADLDKYKDSVQSSLVYSGTQLQKPIHVGRTFVMSRSSCTDGGKWGASMTRELAAHAKDVWEMVGSFSGMKRWNRSVEVCEVVEGEDGKPGCVRYCAGGGHRPDGSPQRWVKEQLLLSDAATRTVTYTMLDSSYGFEGYYATLSISSSDGGDGEQSCCATWTFELDPVLHIYPDDLFRNLCSIFERMMCSLEQTILISADPNSASLSS